MKCVALFNKLYTILNTHYYIIYVSKVGFKKCHKKNIITYHFYLSCQMIIPMMHNLEYYDGQENVIVILIYCCSCRYVNRCMIS